MRKKSNNLLALSAAALVVNGVSHTASANPPDGKTKVDYRYTAYEEADIKPELVASGSLSRYTIDVHHLKVKTPISGDTEISGYLISETMSGASPWYVRPDAEGYAVQVMSGPTIDESRIEVGADFRSYNDQSESTFSLSYSTENDYESIGFGYSGAWRFNENLTSLSYGINGAKDYIDATDANTSDYEYRPTGETKTRMGGFVGLSRVVTKTTLVSGSVGIALLEGYLSDPYKLVWIGTASSPIDVVQDSRPDTQSQFSLGLSLREYFPRLNGAFHANYGFYNNDWEIESHTMDVAWYQNIPYGFQLIPSFRFYSQTAAVFYSPYYLSTRNDGYYSSDYRLSEYTSSAGRIRLQRSWDKYSVNLTYENYVADGDHPAMLEYSYVGFGLSVEL